MDVIREDIEKAVEKELGAAIERFGMNHSYHEQAALIREEMDEAKAEMENCEWYYDMFWTAVKRNNDVSTRVEAQALYRAAVRLACEAVQVAAMAKMKVLCEKHE